MHHRVEVDEAETERQFRALVGERLRHDAATGFNKYAGSIEPVVVTLAARVRDFLESLEDVMGHQAARGIQRRVGFNSGSEGAKLVMRGLGMDPMRAFLAFPGVLAGAGWGRSTLDYDDASRSIRCVYPHGTAIAAATATRRSEPACAYTEGVIGGWAAATIGETGEVLETECLAARGAACVFETPGTTGRRSG